MYLHMAMTCSGVVLTGNIEIVNIEYGHCCRTTTEQKEKTGYTHNNRN